MTPTDQIDHALDQLQTSIDDLRSRLLFWRVLAIGMSLASFLIAYLVT